jgi:hypothetical protein
MIPSGGILVVTGYPLRLHARPLPVGVPWQSLPGIWKVGLIR